MSRRRSGTAAVSAAVSAAVLALHGGLDLALEHISLCQPCGDFRQNFGILVVGTAFGR